VWPELAGQTLGIVGYGRIGRALARRARAFDMRILAIRRDVARAVGDDLDRLGGLEILHEVLREADHLVVALPLSESTRRLLGARELALMKRTAVLINVGRADVVDPDALYAALAGGRLGGAALDVWYRYPTDGSPTLPAREPFHELPNVLMTPHVSGWTEGMLQARARLIADNIARAARGEPPLNHIPPIA
jgi:phosphoglycerate dehydrogenase-like enzyme